MSNLYTTPDVNGDPKETLRPKSVVAITGATSLDKSHNSAVLNLSAAAGAQIDLPAVADIDSGWSVKVFTGTLFDTTNWTIVSATNVIQGHALVAGAHVAASNENTISFVATADSLGDFVDIMFDGTNFIVFGSAVTSGAITFTAP